MTKIEMCDKLDRMIVPDIDEIVKNLPATENKERIIGYLDSAILLLLEASGMIYDD